MRGSLLAVVAVAVVLGLGVVALVRAMGWLSPPPAPVVQPVVTTPPPAPPPPQVLVAGRPMYAGDMVDAAALLLRPLRPYEVKDFEANRADYLVSMESAVLRDLARDISADTPLKKADLAPVQKPEPLHARLAPGTRAVDLAVPRELAAGGLIAVGDWVDVLVLTDVSRTDSAARVPQSGVLVQAAPVIAKRSSLFAVFSAQKDGPIGHMVAVNPYRAALLDYARSVGTISLVPVSAAEKRRLDTIKTRAATNPATASAAAIPFAEPGSPEFRDEVERIEKYNRGELAVGRADLARVLQLAPPAPKAPAVQIELFRGTARAGTASFDPPGGPPIEYVFSAPTARDGTPAPGTTVRPVTVPPKN